jgi:hypothetical protein
MGIIKLKKQVKTAKHVLQTHLSKITVRTCLITMKKKIAFVAFLEKLPQLAQNIVIVAQKVKPNSMGLVWTVQ